MNLRLPSSPRACTTVRRPAAVAAVSAALLLVAAAPASAHERWFAEHADGGEWSFFLSPVPLLLTAAVVAAAVVWRAVGRRLPRPELRVLEPLGRLAPYVPRLLAIHLGVSLLAFSVTGAFLTPSLPLEDVPGQDLAGVVQAAVGIWLITGVRLRPAAAGVVLLGPPALLAAGPVALLETAGLLGIALFLAILPPSDGTFGRVDPSPERLRAALLSLRALVAVALVALAFSEKFTNPQLARNTLEAYPQLDVFGLVGITVPTDVFIAVAGAVELLFGLLVLSGAIPQVAVLVAMVPFNATLVLFGTTEVIGHLPVYGVFLTLLVYGSNRATADAVPWLPRAADVRALRSLRRPGLSRPQPSVVR
ncbi:hypothetical protein [Cellulomonas carbonis]|uniref:DoxX family protein n=1 Tax=Cellulomonas carbonis T26 TaxID=947969 RepID=A0A0A0BMJ3_9CELL|nr:hypothetical protein [Cellulomonas carbonis]KGM09135.1 hypothetical protein N868_04400 [Cellulomonas carbonis T26]GGB96019.1 hypothetical protein GCM10010972_05950 [Cellulomonas carbonis]